MVDGGIYPPDKCFCAQFEQKKGNRSLAKSKDIKIQPYEKLLEPSFWFEKGVWSGSTSNEIHDGLTVQERELFSSTAAGGSKKNK
jgi:hypothetical protein